MRPVATFEPTMNILACIFIIILHLNSAMSHMITFDHNSYMFIHRNSIGLFNVNKNMMNHTLRTISELEDLSAPLYFTVKNYIQSAYEEDKTAHVVVLCTQLSLDRLHSLYDLQRHWLGPISAVLYVKESDNIQDAEAHVMTFFKEKLPPNHRINLHLMFSQVFTTPFHANFDYDIAYPVNALRNLATMCAETEYVLSLDVDFVPSVGLYPFILKHAKSLRNFNKTAFVLPAFEWEKYDDSETLKSGPNMDKMLWDYNSLMEACLKGEAIPFRYLKRKKQNRYVKYATRLSRRTRSIQLQAYKSSSPDKLSFVVQKIRKK